MIDHCISTAWGLLGLESRLTVKLRTKQQRLSLPASLSTVDVALLESLFDHAPDVAFFVKDAAGRYLAVNESLVERHGLKQKSEVIGKCSRDICPGDFGNIPSNQDAEVLHSGRPLVDHLELHWYRPHEPVWCLTTKLPIRDADGEVVGLIGFSRDVRAPIDAQEIPVDFAAALEEFERKLAGHVTPAWFARRARLTSQRLARLTKRLFGLTPSQFITKTRIAAASRLLRETKRSISEIAGECGFYDHSAFTRAFRSATGVPPSEFRDRV
ncbi:MAG: AraC family transcriptional regulator [Pirellula sp.]|nr:AraC family transcriptional regulator [Pirellula sp.]